jgi:lipoprotein NlpD
LTPEGRYRVRRGDSLHAIAFDFGLDWRDLARWNRIEPPYTIYPDQELRLSPPQAQPARTVETRPAGSPGAATSREGPTTPLPEPPQAEPGAQATPNVTAATAPTAADTGLEVPSTPGPETRAGTATDPGPEVMTAPPSAAPATSTQPDSGPLRDPDRWLWPVEGRVLSSFRSNDPARNGIDIGGQHGQPVRASAAGEVVYSGSGLIGYGELIIVKHSDRMLSAYAHNRQRLVQEGQRVAAGEQIAEMGRNDRNQAILHFEIRVNGTPEDPLKYLPRR